jgi:MFS family permease
VLGRPAVRLGAAVLVLTYICFTSMLFLVPQYLQSVEGHSVIEVGLLLVPFAVAFAVTSAQVPTSMDRIGEPRLLVIGSVQLTVGVGLLAVASQLGGTSAVLGATALMGVGIGLLITPASTVTMNDLPSERAGEGSATNMVSRYVGAALGVAVTGTVFASVYSHHVADRLDSAGSRTVDQARTGIHAALVRSDELGGAAGADVARAARASFETGMTAAFTTLCILCAIAAVAVRFATSRMAQTRRPDAPNDN